MCGLSQSLRLVCSSPQACPIRSQIFYHFRGESEQAPVETVEQDRVVPEDEAMQGLEDAAGEPLPASLPLPDQAEAGVPACIAQHGITWTLTSMHTTTF